MAQNHSIATSLAPELPERGDDKPLPANVMRFIQRHLDDANAYDLAALQAEMNAAANQNDAYRQRQLAEQEIGDIVAYLRQMVPHGSQEQRYDYLKAHMFLTENDLMRVWNALMSPHLSR